MRACLVQPRHRLACSLLVLLSNTGVFGTSSRSDVVRPFPSAASLDIIICLMDEEMKKKKERRTETTSVIPVKLHSLLFSQLRQLQFVSQLHSTTYTTIHAQYIKCVQFIAPTLEVRTDLPSSAEIEE